MSDWQKGLSEEDKKNVAAMRATMAEGLPLKPMPPPVKELDPSVPHAPRCPLILSPEDARVALANALRYFPEELHAELAPEFAEELRRYGHIYMYRFRPVGWEMKAYPFHCYPARTTAGKALQLMICNNLDRRVAQFPHELVTYGGTGHVFQNWAQFRLAVKYINEMTDEQTMPMYSGHPAGLYPSPKSAPRVIITNGMVIPHYSDGETFERLRAMGCTMYGQMTAGSYCYIGPQGIVHGTTLTLLNAGRRYLNGCEDLHGKVYVTSGLGGMSGAQGKASRICGAIGVIAEVCRAAIDKRKAQGWVDEVFEESQLEELIARVKVAREKKESVAIAWHGNVVALWERFVKETSFTPELGSDQTSLHNPYFGGYYPVQISFDEANVMMADEPEKFRALVDESLRRQVAAINTLAARGLKFWDYGNSFMLSASRAGADIVQIVPEDPFGHNWHEVIPPKKTAVQKFRYPSYVQDIMGAIFSLGFGPFRWVCTSGDPADLEVTDKIAAEVIERLASEPGLPPVIAAQYRDNHLWITQASANKLVVGSQARILYSDANGRIQLAVAFNNAVRDGKLKAPVVMSRDHHDVSGTDSPFRETSDVRDGSQLCADMAVQNFVGDAFRGATWVALHNGGGTGWGEAINGGFGFVLDGTEDAEKRARTMLLWDVNNGVSRRAWAGSDNANLAIHRAAQQNPNMIVTTRTFADKKIIDAALDAAFTKP